MILGYSEFELDIESILRAQLPSYFDQVCAAPLTNTGVSALPPGAKGAYMLLHRVYAATSEEYPYSGHVVQGCAHHGFLKLRC
jgi:hypothetical protein